MESLDVLLDEVAAEDKDRAHCDAKDSEDLEEDEPAYTRAHIALATHVDSLSAHFVLHVTEYLAGSSAHFSEGVLDGGEVVLLCEIDII